MTDHGHDLIFGTLLEPTPERPLDVVQLTAGERPSCMCRDGTFGRCGCRAPRSRIAS